MSCLHLCMRSCHTVSVCMIVQISDEKGGDRCWFRCLLASSCSLHRRVPLCVCVSVCVSVCICTSSCVGRYNYICTYMTKREYKKHMCVYTQTDSCTWACAALWKGVSTPCVLQLQACVSCNGVPIEAHPKQNPLPPSSSLHHIISIRLFCRLE